MDARPGWRGAPCGPRPAPRRPARCGIRPSPDAQGRTTDAPTNTIRWSTCGLGGLTVVKQVTGAGAANVAPGGVGVEGHDGLRVREFTVANRGRVGDAEQRPTIGSGARRGLHIRKLRAEGQAEAAPPFRGVSSERLAKREADERRAVGDFWRRLFELAVGQQREPGPERGAVGLVGQSNLRRRRRQQRGGHQHSE